MKIKISPFAEKDLDDSIVYYNDKKEGLGIEFVKEVVDTFERITENPGQFPKVYKDMRKAKIDVFSFNIFFIISETIAYILGIFHTSRNPKKMKSRYKLNQ